MKEEKIDELDLKYTVFWPLDEMEKVAKKDLLLFLRTHNIDLPIDQRDRVLNKILDKTGGRYEHTIEELRKIRNEALSAEDMTNGKWKKIAKKIFDY